MEADGMFQIESVSRGDGTSEWYVKHRNAMGDVIEVKASSGEVAVAYALLAVKSMSRARTASNRSPISGRACVAALPARGCDPSNMTRIQAPPTTGGINRVGSRRPNAAVRNVATCGQRMAQRRLELNLTQAQVAARVTIESKSGKHEGKRRLLSRNSYAMYELGSAEPRLGTIRQIADALSVDRDWLAWGAT